MPHNAVIRALARSPDGRLAFRSCILYVYLRNNRCRGNAALDVSKLFKRFDSGNRRQITPSVEPGDTAGIFAHLIRSSLDKNNYYSILRQTTA